MCLFQKIANSDGETLRKIKIQNSENSEKFGKVVYLLSDFENSYNTSSLLSK